MNEGQLVACEVVWTEVAGFFDSPEMASDALDRINVEYSPMNVRSALLASTGWRAYRMRGDRRERVVADFLIGAHSMVQAERLLTRDRGFYRQYFKKLRVLDPSA